MTNPTVIEELRQLAREGRRPSALLRHIAAREGVDKRVLSFQLICYLRSAFGLSLRDVHLVGGWGLDGGGEVPDSRIDDELTEKIKTAVLGIGSETCSSLVNNKTE